MTLAAFCAAVYKRNPPVTSQAKFIQRLFEAAGTMDRISDDNGAKLFKRVNPLSRDWTEQFQNPVPAGPMCAFLKEHLTPDPSRRQDLADRLREVARLAGFTEEQSADLVADDFLLALTDWFNAVIHHPQSSDGLRDYYFRRRQGAVIDQQGNRAPLYSGDRVDVIHPPGDQNHEPMFWSKFEHTWILRNNGQVRWAGRTLVCDNPTDRIRPTTEKVEIPDSSPSSSNLISVSMQFDARGIEGRAESCWRMVDESGGDCFPGAKQFNVVADVGTRTSQGARSDHGRHK